jgi:hypothetical protein
MAQHMWEWAQQVRMSAARTDEVATRVDLLRIAEDIEVNADALAPPVGAPERTDP